MMALIGDKDERHISRARAKLGLQMGEEKPARMTCATEA